MDWSRFITIEDSQGFSRLTCEIPATENNEQIWQQIRRDLVSRQLTRWYEEAKIKAAMMPVYATHDSAIRLDVDQLCVRTNTEHIYRPPRTSMKIKRALLYMTEGDLMAYFIEKAYDFEDHPPEIEIPEDSGFIIGPCRYLVDRDLDEVDFRIRIIVCGLNLWFYYHETADGAEMKPGMARTDGVDKPITPEMAKKVDAYTMARQNDIIKKAQKKPLNTSGISESASIQSRIVALCKMNSKGYNIWSLNPSDAQLANPNTKCAIFAQVEKSNSLYPNKVLQKMCLLDENGTLFNATYNPHQEGCGVVVQGRKNDCEFLLSKIRNTVKKGKIKNDYPRAHRRSS